MASVGVLVDVCYEYWIVGSRLLILGSWLLAVGVGFLIYVRLKVLISLIISGVVIGCGVLFLVWWKCLFFF